MLNKSLLNSQAKGIVMKIDHSHLKFIKNSDWINDIVQRWDTQEQNKRWLRYAQEEKGFPNVHEWRKSSFILIEGEKRKWTRYKVLDPQISFPQFYIGPFNGWQNHADNKLNITFFDLVTQNLDWVKQNDGIIGIKPPLDTSHFWGIYFPHNNRIYLMDGCHRSSRITLSTHFDQPMPIIGDQIIDLTIFNEDEFGILKRILEN